MRKLSGKEKNKRVNEFITSSKFFNEKNRRYINYYSAHHESTYANEDHICPLTGEHAVNFIIHDRIDNKYSKVSNQGLSFDAIRMIGEKIGRSLKHK